MVFLSKYLVHAAISIMSAKYAEISGYGAKKAGGRWNCKGIAALYTVSPFFQDLLLQ